MPRDKVFYIDDKKCGQRDYSNYKKVANEFVPLSDEFLAPTALGVYVVGEAENIKTQRDIGAVENIPFINGFLFRLLGCDLAVARRAVHGTFYVVGRTPGGKQCPLSSAEVKTIAKLAKYVRECPARYRLADTVVANTAEALDIRQMLTAMVNCQSNLFAWFNTRTGVESYPDVPDAPQEKDEEEKEKQDEERKKRDRRKVVHEGEKDDQ